MYLFGRRESKKGPSVLEGAFLIRVVDNFLAGFVRVMHDVDRRLWSFLLGVRTALLHA